MNWTVDLERQARIKLNAEKVRKTLAHIASAAERHQKLGFTGEVIEVAEPEVIGILTRCAERKEWRVVGHDGSTPVEPHDAAPAPTARPPFRLPELTAEAFDGIYERDAHIRLIHDSMLTYVSTTGQKASHILLYGDPGSAKRSLFQRFKELYEKDGDVERVVFIDTHTMTKAGLEDWLLQRAADKSLPEVLVLEELEKQDARILLPLISVMASGCIRKTNARVGRKVQETKVAVWGTCNNENLLRRFHDGALWSRFTHKLRCVRPSRELLREILLREVAERPDGNPAWADEALRFGWDVLKTNDPREIIGLLDGRDRLLTGAYQSDYLAVGLALGWPVPQRILDLHAEFRWLTSGLDVHGGYDLASALDHFGVAGDSSVPIDMESLTLCALPPS
jgi:hypothetical protein